MRENETKKKPHRPTIDEFDPIFHENTQLHHSSTYTPIAHVFVALFIGPGKTRRKIRVARRIFAGIEGLSRGRRLGLGEGRKGLLEISHKSRLTEFDGPSFHSMLCLSLSLCASLSRVAPSPFSLISHTFPSTPAPRNAITE